eukprot:2054261-Amphidinium_carterae.1
MRNGLRLTVDGYRGCLGNDRTAEQIPIYGDYILGDQAQQEANIPRTVHWKHQPLLHKQKSTNTTSLTCHIVVVQTLCTRKKQTAISPERCNTYANRAKHNATMLTMCESTTGLGHAMMVPYKGTNVEAIKAITRFIVENGLQTTILQSDG